jgi:hypothetical protein
VHAADREMIPVRNGVSGAVRGTAGYKGDYWAAIGRSDILLLLLCLPPHTHTHIHIHTVRTLAGWVAADRNSPRNLARVHLSHSQQGSCHALCAEH